MACDAMLPEMKCRPCGSGFQPRSARQDAAPTGKMANFIGSLFRLAFSPPFLDEHYFLIHFFEMFYSLQPSA
jgi:hypothetical protein